MFFYSITPALYDVRKIVRLYRCVIVLCILFLTHLIGCFDERYLLYFPCYAVGLCFGNSIVSMIDSLKVYGIVIPVMWIVSILLKWEHVSVVFGITAIIYLTTVIIRYLKVEVIMSAIKICSYSILCGYLFHRQIINVFHRQMHLALYWMPLFILILSYGIQRLYDMLTLKYRAIHSFKQKI